MKHAVLPVLFALSVSVLPAGPLPAEELAPKAVDAQAAAAMAAANNTLALELYGALRGSQGNLVFSPYSVLAAMSMVREGAAGETAAQMDRVLHLGGLARSAAYRALRESLRPGAWQEEGVARAGRRTSYALNVANAVWGQTRYFVKDEFLRPLREDYGAPLLRVDFDRPRAASAAINRWVARETRNRIRGIVGPEAIPPLTRLAVANAVHFKANWQEAFAKSATKPEIFFGPGGRQTQVPTMWQVEHHAYAEMPGVQILALPYVMGETEMVVFLPRAKDGLAEVEEKLCAGSYGDWAKALEAGERRVDLKLPRFEVESSFELSRVLAGLGMADAFDAQKADFSRVSEREDLFLAAVLHKGWIKVDEEGTEAAAATVLMACGAEATPSEPVAFRADHPFLFLIRHVRTGAVLFLGRVSHPRS